MRRKIKLAWIENDSSRKASFKKRRAGLLKKVRELTTLCDVSACLIIYGPGDLYPAAVWPNEEEARRLIRRFRLVPEIQRSKKMINQEDYLKDRASKMAEQLRKMSHRNGERTASSVLSQIEQGAPLEEFGTGELARVVWLLEDKMREIDRRVELFRCPLPQCPPAGFALPPPTEEEMSGHQKFPWDWFSAQREREQPPDQFRHFVVEGGKRSRFRFHFRAANEGGNVGFQPYGGSGNSSRNEASHGNRNEGNTLGFQPYYGNGNKKSNKVNFNENYSQEIRISGNKTTLPNLGFGGINVTIGGNIDSVIGLTNKNTNASVSIINISHYNINGGIGEENSSSNEGNNSGLDEIEESMASGMVINEETSSSGTSGGGGDSDSDSGGENEAQTPLELNNQYWPAL